MSLYFLRHGQSDANLAGVFSPADAMLTDLGKQQAHEAAEQLRSYGIQKIVCSGLERSWQTASIVADALGISHDEIKRDTRLNEYDPGSLTGKPSSGVRSAVLTAAPLAEDPALFQARALDGMRDYANAEENTLIVGHAGVGCVLEAKRRTISPADFFDLPEYPNCTIVELDTSWLK